MKKILIVIMNFLFYSIVILIAIIISSIALTKKVDDYRLQNQQGISGTVVKQQIPVLAFEPGVIEKLDVTTGDKVTKGDVIVLMDNPDLLTQVNTLEQFKNNSSAQTEAQVGEQQLNNLTIKAPVDGIIGPIEVAQGTPIQSLTKLLTIYSNIDIKLLVYLDESEYAALQQIRGIRAYSPRLNQSFNITPDVLSPHEEKLSPTTSKKIGLYFKFDNPIEAQSLLDNEDLQLDLTNKLVVSYEPLILFVNFWNHFLSPRSQ